MKAKWFFGRPVQGLLRDACDLFPQRWQSRRTLTGSNPITARPDQFSNGHLPSGSLDLNTAARPEQFSNRHLSTATFLSHSFPSTYLVKDAGVDNPCNRATHSPVPIQSQQEQCSFQTDTFRVFPWTQNSHLPQLSASQFSRGPQIHLCGRRCWSR